MLRKPVTPTDAKRALVELVLRQLLLPLAPRIAAPLAVLPMAHASPLPKPPLALLIFAWNAKRAMAPVFQLPPRKLAQPTSVWNARTANAFQLPKQLSALRIFATSASPIQANAYRKQVQAAMTCAPSAIQAPASAIFRRLSLRLAPSAKSAIPRLVVVLPSRTSAARVLAATEAQATAILSPVKLVSRAITAQVPARLRPMSAAAQN